MKTYSWKTDAGSGEIRAANIDNALARIAREENINATTIADGAWAWVEPSDGSEPRKYIAEENVP